MYRYNITVPLIHNAYELFVDNPIVKDIYEIKGEYVDDCLFEGTTLKVYTQNKTNYCELIGISADNSAQAKFIAKQIITYVCKELTYIYNLDNSNLHSLQPRIEADWSKTVCEEIELKETIPLDITDTNEFSITGIDVMQISDSVSITLSSIIDPNKIKISWRKNDNLEYLMEELYIAFGTENIRSKFMHLYGIIEHLEYDKDLMKHSGSAKAFTPETIEKIQEYAKEELGIDDDNLDKMNSSLKKLYDIGKKQVIVNILNYMGVTNYVFMGKSYPITKKLFDELSDIRNSIAHGRTVKEEAVIVSIEKLFDIDIQIIDYYRKHLNET